MAEDGYRFSGGAGGAGSGTSGQGLPSTVVSKTSAYTAAAGEFVKADTSSAGFTVTLPTAPAAGALVTVKKISSDANTLTIAPAGGGTIDGDGDATTATKGGGAVFEHVGANVWQVAAVTISTGPVGPPGPTGAVGSTGATGAQGPAGTSGAVVGQSIAVETRTGARYHALPGQPIANLSPSDGYTSAGPIFISKAVTADRIGIHVTQSAASAKMRLGIYNDDGSMNPSTLLLDAGQVDSSTTGFKEITISQALPAGIYWLSCTMQGAGTLMEGTQYCPVIVPWTVATAMSQVSPCGYANNGGDSGALPATFVPTYIQSQIPRVLLRVA